MTKQQQVIYLNIIKAIYDTSTANTIFNVVVRSLSRVQLFATPWTVACQASLSFTISRSFLELMSIESVMPSSHLILCFSLLLLPSIFSSIRVFCSELALNIRGVCVCVCVLNCFSHARLFVTLWTVSLPMGLLCPWDSSGKNTGLGCLALLQGISLTQGLNSGLLTSPELAGRFFTTTATCKALFTSGSQSIGASAAVLPMIFSVDFL